MRVSRLYRGVSAEDVAVDVAVWVATVVACVFGGRHVARAVSSMWSRPRA